MDNSDLEKAVADFLAADDSRRHLERRRLEKIGKPAVPRLIEILTNDTLGWKVRQDAGDALKEIKDPDCVPAMISVARDRLEARGIRMSAVGVLNAIHDKRSVALLIAIYGEETVDNTMRWLAAETICKIASESDDAFPVMIKMLQDEVWMIRNDAAISLGVHGGNAAIAPLLGALADHDERVRKNVVLSLVKLGATAIAEEHLFLLMDRQLARREEFAQALIWLKEAAKTTPTSSDIGNLDSLGLKRVVAPRRIQPSQPLRAPQPRTGIPI